MDFSTYQKQAHLSAAYPVIGHQVIYPLLGLNGEIGEVTEKIKKIFRDSSGVITEEKKLDLSKELGDVLWYLTEVASSLELELNDIAEMNIAKLTSRKERGVLHGSGDDR